jgi:hypothetical protein
LDIPRLGLARVAAKGTPGRSGSGRRNSAPSLFGMCGRAASEDWLGSGLSGASQGYVFFAATRTHEAFETHAIITPLNKMVSSSSPFLVYTIII